MRICSRAKTLSRWLEAAMHGAFLLLLLTAAGPAQDFTYTTNNGTITITGARLYGSMGAVSIPSAINSLPVVAIGGGAFLTNLYLTSITIPSSVTNIGIEAFEECLSLTNVAMAEGLITIEGNAFTLCVGLRSVTIPNSVTSIGFWGFELCSNLTDVTVGRSVTAINNAFAECRILTNLYFKGNAPTLADFLPFQDDTNTTVYYLPGTQGWGSTFGGFPAKLWNPHIETSDGGFGVRQNLFGFNIAGTAAIPLIVEASTSTANGSWVTLQTGTLTNGFIYFSDPQWTNYPNRLYRIRSP